jgi:hypothetical protein
LLVINVMIPFKFIILLLQLNICIILQLTLILSYMVRVSKTMCHLFRTDMHHTHRPCNVWRSGIVHFMDNLGMTWSVVFLTTMMCLYEISLA